VRTNLFKKKVVGEGTDIKVVFGGERAVGEDSSISGRGRCVEREEEAIRVFTKMGKG